MAILDDAVASLDEVSQAAMMSIVREELSSTTVISVSHRAGLENFHDRTLTLQRADGGPRLAPQDERAVERPSRKAAPSRVAGAT